ncbi:ameloblastin [Lissotriton helveticus]
MGLWAVVWCLIGTSFALPIYPQQGGMPGMASMSYERMKPYGSPNGINIHGMNMRPQYGFGDRFPSWWMHGPSAAYPWMPLRPREHETQQYEYAVPVHPPPLPAQLIPLQPPEPGLQAKSLPQQPPLETPVRQEPHQPGQQLPVQGSLPALQQGEQTLVQQQVAPPEGQPQQLPMWDYTDQNGRSLFPVIQKWLQYGSMQPVQPQLVQGPVQPVQPQLHQGPTQNIQPHLHQGSMQPVHPHLEQGSVQPLVPQLNQVPMQPVPPQLHQGPMHPFHPQLHQGPMQPVHPPFHHGPVQPVHPHFHQGPGQPVHPHFHQGPVQPVHHHQGSMQPIYPQLHQGPINHPYPGLYYMQYATDPAGSPAKVGIVSSEEMQGSPGGGAHAFGALYPGYVGMGAGHSGGGMTPNSAVQGEFTTEDDTPLARGSPVGQGGVVVVQNGNTPVVAPNTPGVGSGTSIADPSLPGNTALIPEGSPTGQGSILPNLNNNVPNLGPDPAGQSKMPLGVTSTQASTVVQAISNNSVPLGNDGTAPVGVQKEVPPTVAGPVTTIMAQSTIAGADMGLQSENKWYFQEP